jgi:phospholipase C
MKRVHVHDDERGDVHPLPIPRRKFLTTSALAIAGGVLFSCTGGKPITSVTDPTPAIDTRWPIKRVIYLMLENRSFNNIFGKFPGVVGTTKGVLDGHEVPLTKCPEWLPADIPHDRMAALTGLNNGAMDGFAKSNPYQYFAYTVFDEYQIPNYWEWAREYAISDHFFASGLGPSYPNHFFFVAGQAAGTIDNPENIEVRWSDGKKYKSWGCDAYGDEVYVVTLDDRGNLTKRDTCFSVKTVGEQLTEKGLDWANYSGTPSQLGYMWNAYNSIGQVFHTDLWHEHTRGIDSLVADIKANNLPPVTWATPLFQLSDHPPASTGYCHNWVTDVVNAVMTSDMWEHTAIFLTWDEWGGFYDQVKPPQIDDYGLGFRVPMLTISPYVKRGVIDDVVGEFSSPLKFISDNWGLPYLTSRIAKTHNFEHVFDFNQQPRTPQVTSQRAPATGDAFHHPTSYPGWPKGTVVPPGNPF